MEPPAKDVRAFLLALDNLVASLEILVDACHQAYGCPETSEELETPHTLN
jgi:hypothetical protein